MRLAGYLVTWSLPGKNQWSSLDMFTGVCGQWSVLDATGVYSQWSSLDMTTGVC